MTGTEVIVGHCKKDEIDVYIGRRRVDGELKHMNNTEVGEPGWLGNPYPVDECESRTESLNKFAADLEKRVNEDAEFRKAVAELDSSDLGCWCRTRGSRKPLCHGDMIKAVIQQLNE